MPGRWPAIAEWAADAPQPVRAALGARRDAPDRCARLAWHQVPVLDRTRDRAHGRVELRTLKAVTVNHFGFPHAAQVIQVTRKTRDLGTRKWRTVVVHAITSLMFSQASPARLADLLRGHWRSRTACTTSAT